MKALIPSRVASLFAVRSRKKGQTLVEYALILAIISVIAVGVFALMGTRIQILFSKVTALLDTAQGSH